VIVMVVAMMIARVTAVVIMMSMIMTGVVAVGALHHAAWMTRARADQRDRARDQEADKRQENDGLIHPLRPLSLSSH
jgi:hypothetical protein